MDIHFTYPTTEFYNNVPGFLMSYDDLHKYNEAHDCYFMNSKDVMTDDKPIGYWFIYDDDNSLFYKDKDGSWQEWQSDSTEYYGKHGNEYEIEAEKLYGCSDDESDDDESEKPLSHDEIFCLEEKFDEYVNTDSDGIKGYTDLYVKWRNSDDFTKKLIDDILIMVCGYSMSTMIKQVRGCEDDE